MRLISCAALCMSALLSGCFTEQLWKPASRDTYRERVSSALISRDGKTLVIVGKDHHYIFDAPPGIVRTLSSDHQRFTEAAFATFHVDESQKITGGYALLIRDSAPNEAKVSAKNAGFHENALGEMRLDGVLSGTRYSAGNVKIEAAAHALNKDYFVEISAPRTGDENLAGKLLLTPIAVLADGVIVIGAAVGAAMYYIPLAIIALPFVAAEQLLCKGSQKC